MPQGRPATATATSRPRTAGRAGTSSTSRTGSARSSISTTAAISSVSTGNADTQYEPDLEPIKKLVVHQLALDLLAQAFSADLRDPQFHAKLQHIKGLFYERQFLEIFNGDPTLLPIYSARYIPYRTLAYLELIHRVAPLRSAIVDAPRPHAVLLGGGAGSELAAILHSRTQYESDHGKSPQRHLTVTTVDIGDYTSVLSRIETAFAPTPSTTYKSSFSVGNLLDSTFPLPVGDATVVTLFFTLNELFAQSKAGAMAFLQRLIAALPRDAILVVADSAGSFSDLTIGSREYKITVLLDMMRGLRRVAGADSLWFRFIPELRYPHKLENMRYFWRVYAVDQTIASVEAKKSPVMAGAGEVSGEGAERRG
ncbi:hypothetical protein AMAG_04551 [Allomyces macrogynus ATCC 38327]|uniref:Methyltransferase type 12 domain-containing protein n=1 Tax=Allomyces macrogynus (strain ATCC 38327) TaxID=578462 RepID=A0A0L0S5A2_ALLM3|nr:hypothetical protein AMAG_04551 [Allomyces macrogynus ATCC 38327]|eukprot:KNE57692.1 hypothetical protein AMAG_04551 [Allomyces macrogynus ATCC 38327]